MARKRAKERVPNDMLRLKCVHPTQIPAPAPKPHPKGISCSFASLCRESYASMQAQPRKSREHMAPGHARPGWREAKSPRVNHQE